MATLKELSEASGVQGIAPGRTVGEQVNEDMYSSGELQYNDVAPADYGYTGQIQDGSKFQDPFYSGLQRVTQFGYNVGSTLMQNNFMQPGSNSFRSYALEGLGSLDQNLANDFYQDNYGKTFDQVKSDIQNKQNPFGPQPTNIGTSDYYGGDNNNNSGGRNETGFGGGFGRDPDDKA